MGVAIGGRRIVTRVTTTRTRRPTVAPITEATVIIIQRLTMTLPRELTAGNRQLMVRTDRLRVGRVTILTPALMREALPSRRLMGAEAQHRHIIRTREPMPRPDRDRARTLSGVAPMSREETRALRWVITQLLTVPLPGFPGRKAARPPARVPPGVTPRLARRPAAICTPGTMVMFTRTLAMAGRNTTMVAGTL